MRSRRRAYVRTASTSSSRTSATGNLRRVQPPGGASSARIEAGDQLPRYRTLVALANALDVPLDRLLVG
jgi:hypothetical protein